MPELIIPQFLPTSDGLYIGIESDRRIPVSEWTSHPGVADYVGAYLRLRDDGLAVEKEEGNAILLYWNSVANLAVEDLRYMGLPSACPYTLEITADNSLNAPDFDLHYGFFGKGRRIQGPERTGALLRVGIDEFILINPLYEIIEAIDQFSTTDDHRLEERMLHWGNISEKLPDDTIIPNHLGSIKITVVTSFKLDPFLNKEGEPDFDPIVGSWQTYITEGEEEKQEFDPALPRAKQSDFARKFRGLEKVKHRYSIGGSSFVVLTPEVEKALDTVHKAQKASPEERRGFLENVNGYLRGTLDEAGELNSDVGRVFCDDGLSERVIGVGIWERETLPWIKLASEPWLPPERLGLRIGSKIIQIEPSELPILLNQVNDAIKSGIPTVVIGSGSEIPAQKTTVSAIEKLIRTTQPIQFPRSKAESKDRRTKSEKGDKPDQVLLVIENLELLLFRRERRKSNPGISNISPKLQSTLLPHQQEALDWLRKHWEAGSWGCLLGDDMGLGKTLESLAFLSCLQIHIRNQRIKSQPILVVAPTGLLKNWLDEHSKHLAGNGLGHAVEAYGTGLRQLKIPISPGGNELASEMALPKLSIDKLKKADWVLTTYETLRDYQHSFGRIHWSAGVFDEAQKIKNPNAQLTVSALAMNIDFALLMTGTPVENRAADIWSLLERVEPGVFGTLKEFSKKHEGERTESYVALEQLNRALTAGNGKPQLMLRRLKKDHLTGLPEKHVHARIVNMPQRQADVYEQAVSDSRHGTSSMLQSLQSLRSISLHPEIPGDVSEDHYIRGSARLSETFKILHEINDLRQKALIFVESRVMQGFLVGALRRHFRLPEDVLVINGAISGKARKARVDTFQSRNGFDVMLLSPRAGGVGLTLTSANHVIHLSRWWNPAVEDQCTDRVFRIGQRKIVHVYIPLARHPHFGDNSFDLKLDELITRKRGLNHRILSPTTANEKDMREIFRNTVLGENVESDGSMEQVNVDLLDPVAFEEWVLNQLASTCDETHRTPMSGDCGADGLAYVNTQGQEYTIVIQCKQLHSDTKCGRKAVEEVLRAMSKYDIRGEPRPMVVTTAYDFTESAKNLAHHEQVELIARNNLKQLQRWEP